jgi:hypothetical protein
MKMELLRLRFDEQVRAEKRKQAGTANASGIDLDNEMIAENGSTWSVPYADLLING